MIDVESHAALVARLSRLSVSKHYDAYGDIAWDAPEHHIDHADPRWEMTTDDPLGATGWYRAQPQATRARLGLHAITCAMKVGLQFEHVLERGLLELIARLPDDAPEKRYAYHEVIEESQHSLMFREFILRAGLPAPGAAIADGPVARAITRLGRDLPELFFVFVLGGEDPIDHVQKRVLASRKNVHPLLERVMKIHITEEARHLAFARSYLREHVPRLSPPRRALLAALSPVILGVMADLMLKPSKYLIQTYRIPADVIDEAYTRNPVHRARTAESVAEVRELLGEIGAVPPLAARLWRRMGLAELAS